jgi:hypothetical protein
MGCEDGCELRLRAHGYSVKQDGGALMRLYREGTELASFHALKNYDQGGFSGVIGSRGSVDFWLTQDLDALMEQGFHEIFVTDEHGLVGRLGADHFKLNQATGLIKSKIPRVH